MSNYWNNQATLPGTELLATMTGSWVTIGALPFPPAKLIFDNQGTASIAISINGGATTWKTFPAGEALVLDQDLGAFPQGTIFSGNGASGNFSIAYTYYKS